MKGINAARVLLGGVAAAVVINLGEFGLWALVLGEQYDAMMAAAGLTEATWAMAGYAVGSLVLGIALAFTYAAIRPRFGAGWQTAIAAALLMWVVGSALPMVWTAAGGLSIGAGATVLALAWTVVEFAIAGLAAGWVYQEQVAPATAPIRERSY